MVNIQNSYVDLTRDKVWYCQNCNTSFLRIRKTNCPRCGSSNVNSSGRNVRFL
jgi:rubrerythrin